MIPGPLRLNFSKRAYPVDTKFTVFSRYQNEGTESGWTYLELISLYLATFNFMTAATRDTSAVPYKPCTIKCSFKFPF